jgi:hypothetical protein
MSTQLMTSNLLEDLSAEEQQLLSGGVDKGSDEGESSDKEDSDEGGFGFDKGTTRVFRVTKRSRSIISILRLR